MAAPYGGYYRASSLSCQHCTKADRPSRRRPAPGLVGELQLHACAMLPGVPDQHPRTHAGGGGVAGAEAPGAAKGRVASDDLDLQDLGWGVRVCVCVCARARARARLCANKKKQPTRPLMSSYPAAHAEAIKHTTTTMTADALTCARHRPRHLNCFV